jgi:hypothetical protein
MYALLHDLPPGACFVVHVQQAACKATHVSLFACLLLELFAVQQHAYMHKHCHISLRCKAELNPSLLCGLCILIQHTGVHAGTPSSVGVCEACYCC